MTENQKLSLKGKGGSRIFFPPGAKMSLLRATKIMYTVHIFLEDQINAGGI